MGFCQWAEMGPNVGFGVQKWVQSGSNPTTFDPLLNHFGISAKTHLLPSLRWVDIVSKKGPEAVPTQHKIYCPCL